MLSHFFLTRNKKIRRIIFKRFKKRLSLASRMHVEMRDRAERIKKLFSTQKQANELHKKNNKTKRRNKYRFIKKAKSLKIKRSKGYLLLKTTTYSKLRKPKVLVIKLSELGRRRLYISKFTLPYHLKFSQPHSKKRV